MNGPRRNIHPFPARMAPDIALEKIEALTKPGAVVLDPMCGSGTVARLAVEESRRAIACDLDPLAVLMTRAACNPAWSEGLEERAMDAVRAAKDLTAKLPDWIADDAESSEFVAYWFAPMQRDALSRLARVLVERPTTDDPLRVALSRLIVTKDSRASLARDTSHSRPHRVRLENEFDVYSEFVRSAARVEKLVGSSTAKHRPSIRKVDARKLNFVETAAVDLIVTSPPYLNAIDYLRGHRLTLVWLGWKLSELRTVRGESIGAERALSGASRRIIDMAHEGVPRVGELPQREQRMIWRFANDMDRLCRSLARVTRRGGHLVFVVADSQLKRVPVSNSTLSRLAAQKHGFELVEQVLRPLPTQHRYLPPPDSGQGSLSGRMREESVLTFVRKS